MKKLISLLTTLALLIGATSGILAKEKARMPGIRAGSDRVIELQRTDTDWEGTWYWYVGSEYNATNLTGVTALGLLEAYKDTKNLEYLGSAEMAANFIMVHLGAEATGLQHHSRITAPDVVFLHNLAEITGDSSYSTRADKEWNNITSYWPTADDLDVLFRSINRPSVWDLAFFLEAAHLSGDTDWADDMAEIIASKDDKTFYYDSSRYWYALNIAGATRSLAYTGYADEYSEEFNWFLSELVSLTGEDGVGGYIQDTSYAILAFKSVNGIGNKYANQLSRWLVSQQKDNGGWLSSGLEYAEIDGEAVRALSSSIGSNVTITKLKGIGKAHNSIWAKEINSQAIPF